MRFGKIERKGSDWGKCLRKVSRKCLRKEKLKIEKILTDIMSPTTMSPTWTWVHVFVRLLCYIFTLWFVFFLNFIFLFVFFFKFYLVICLLFKIILLLLKFYPFICLFCYIFMETNLGHQVVAYHRKSLLPLNSVLGHQSFKGFKVYKCWDGL